MSDNNTLGITETLAALEQEEAEQLKAAQAEEAEQEASQQQTEEVPSETSEDIELPEKFKGKSAAEIARSALEAEKRMHDVTSQLSSLRREMEETKARQAELQASYQQPQQQEEDPLAELDRSWDEDPKQAVAKTLKRIHETAKQREERVARELEMRQRQKEGVDFYTQQKSANPDFVEREPDMVQLSSRFAHIIRPEFANSKDVMEALYYAARGMRLDAYEKAAVEKAKKQQESIKDEKRKAVSERAGAASTPAPEMDLDEWMKLSPAKQAEELAKEAKRLGRAS